MHSPVVAAALRELGHDVVAVADDPTLRSKADPELASWAVQQGRCIVTENVKDFRRILVRCIEAGLEEPHLLYTSSRRFPRSRHNPGPLIRALDAWLRQPSLAARPQEEWLHSG